MQWRIRWGRAHRSRHFRQAKLFCFISVHRRLCHLTWRPLSKLAPPIQTGAPSKNPGPPLPYMAYEMVSAYAIDLQVKPLDIRVIGESYGVPVLIEYYVTEINHKVATVTFQPAIHNVAILIKRAWGRTRGFDDMIESLSTEWRKESRTFGSSVV